MRTFHNTTPTEEARATATQEWRQELTKKNGHGEPSPTTYVHYDEDEPNYYVVIVYGTAYVQA